MNMDSPNNVSERTDGLCEQCATVDFPSLFSSEIKAFRIGTLSSIVNNDTCPFRRLMSHAINNSWMSRSGEFRSTTDLSHVDIWVKTTFWAQYDYPTMYNEPLSHQRDTSLRFRPALGVDWMPENVREIIRNGGSIWNPTNRSTICELDNESTDQYFPFTTHPHSDRTQLLRRRLIPRMVDTSLIRSWVEECQRTHDHPGQRAASQAQLRATGQFRVYDVIESHLIAPTDRVEYIALSYMWGNALHERQLADPNTWWIDLFDGGEQIQSTSQGRCVLFDKLPVTIQDASLLLQRLGWRYLWVDLLCVCQDDIPKKELLINKMHLTYEGASLTLAAAGGEHADSPLHGLRNDTRSSERSWTIPTAIGDLNLVIARPELKELLSSTLWTTRGWTFQEDILSSCCLYFTQDEVFYSCDHHMPQQYLSTVGDFRGFGHGRFNEWREGYVLETKFTRSAYQSLSQWNEGWYRSLTCGLRCDNAVIRRSNTEHLADEDDLRGLWQFHRGSNNPDYFHEYATLVGEYTRRNLTKTGDILGAFMGILCKFGIKLRIGTDIQFHGLLNSHMDHHDLCSNPLEKALLWIPSQATALRRRCIESHRSTVAHRQFPSWAWSGWVGAVDYLLQESSDLSSRAWDLSSQQSDWMFSPATFAPKVGSLHMRKSFQWSRRGDRRIIGRLLETEESHANTPEERIDARAPCVLTLFTHVAQVGRLTEQFGFVGQNFQTWVHHPFWNIHSTRGNGSDCAAILLDSGTRRLENGYRIACIGKGQRERPVQTTQGMRADVKLEWVVLLLSQKTGGYERIGLTIVRPDDFEWTLEWIDIV